MDKVSMEGPAQTVIWADLPFANNPFPSVEFPTFGLGGETETTLIYVPVPNSAPKNIHMVEKQISEGIAGGRAHDLIIPQTATQKKAEAENMKGGGASSVRNAFQHPIKVQRRFLVIFLYFFLSIAGDRS